MTVREYLLAENFNKDTKIIVSTDKRIKINGNLGSYLTIDLVDFFYGDKEVKEICNNIDYIIDTNEVVCGMDKNDNFRHTVKNIFIKTIGIICK